MFNFTVGYINLYQLYCVNKCLNFRSAVGAPVVSECEGEYHYNNRKNILEWTLPLIDESNKSGSMEFSINGHPDDFFPVNVSFVSKKPYCDIEVIRIYTIFK